MEARVRVDGELLEEIKVTNGLRQGCTLAPTLFTIYASIVAEHCLDRIGTMEDVGTLIITKQNGLLFRRSTRYANRKMMYKGEFADDVVPLARSREAACAPIKANS